MSQIRSVYANPAFREETVNITDKLGFNTLSGSYQIKVSGNIVICTFSGACCEMLAERYLHHLRLVAKRFNGQCWAFLGNAHLHQAATPQAEQFIVLAYLAGIQSNCIADAYCLSSPVGIAQLAEIRQRLGIVSKMQDRMFADLPTAKAKLFEELADALRPLNT